MKYENRIFQNETVHLDNHSFRNCEFWDCVLIYAGGNLDLDNLAGKNIEVRFDGPAKGAQLLFMKLQAFAMNAVPIGSIMVVGTSRFRKIEPEPVDVHLIEPKAG